MSGTTLKVCWLMVLVSGCSLIANSRGLQSDGPQEESETGSNEEASRAPTGGVGSQSDRLEQESETGGNEEVSRTPIGGTTQTDGVITQTGGTVLTGGIGVDVPSAGGAGNDDDGGVEIATGGAGAGGVDGGKTGVTETADATAGAAGGGFVVTSRDPVIPLITGECPAFQTTSFFNYMGVTGQMEVGPKMNGPGAIVFYWHGTNSNSEEFRGRFGANIPKITGDGGIIVAF